MATVTYDYEAGTVGAATTVGSTGALSGVAGTGNTMTHVADGVSGSLAVEHSGAVTTACILDFTSFTNATGEDIYWAFKITAAFDVTTTIMQWYGGNTGAIAVMRLQVTAAGQLQVTDVGTAHTGVVNANISAQYGTWVAVRLQTSSTGTLTTNGALKVRYYTDPFAAVGTFAGSELSVTNYSLGGDGTTAWPVVKIRVGILSLQTTGKVIRQDYLSVISGSTAWVAPPTASGAPTAVATATSTGGLYVVAGTTVTLSAASSTGTGTLTYQWGPAFTEIPVGAATPSLSAPTAVTTTFVAATPGWYTVPLAVVQSVGGSNTTSITIYVYPASNSAVLVHAQNGATTSTNEGGAASLVAAINDSSNTTFAQSPVGPVAATDIVPLIMNPFGPGTVAVTITADEVSATTATARVRIYKEDGTTVIGDTTHTITATITTYTTDVDETLIPALSDRRALRVSIAEAAA